MATEPEPGDPFPNPAETPVPSEQPPAEPIGIPQPGPDIVDPGGSPGIVDPGTPIEIPTVPTSL